jgi:hypothetical protein
MWVMVGLWFLTEHRAGWMDGQHVCDFFDGWIRWIAL